jgi:hypothetical protein
MCFAVRVDAVCACPALACPRSGVERLDGAFKGDWGLVRS